MGRETTSCCGDPTPAGHNGELQRRRALAGLGRLEEEIRCPGVALVSPAREV
jgi:hypothetical protein